jgi:inhibitor of cysteine peptidase
MRSPATQGEGRRGAVKKTKILLVILATVLVVGVVAAGCGSSTPSTTATTPSDNIVGSVTGESIQATVGQQFQVTLDSNPTTGYQWSITTKPDPKVVTEVGTSVFIAPSSSAMGAPGTEVWTFKGAGVGNTNIVLENKQVSAAAGATPAQTHNVSVTVVAKPSKPAGTPKTYTNPATPISTTAGNEFLINMSEQTASTGYKWLLAPAYDHKVCVFEGVTFVTAANAAPGAPQIEVWRFSAVGKGTTNLSFKYLQPWNTSAAPAKTAVFTANVS